METHIDDMASVRLTRRRILAVGGFSVAAAAVVAACAPDPTTPQVPQAGEGASTTAAAEQNITDAVLLRTSSSLEHSLMDSYTKVLALNVLPNDVAALVRSFVAQHTQHAQFFERTTLDIGGQPYGNANTALQDNIVDPALKSIADAGNKPEDLAWFSYGLENLAAGTFQLFVPTLTVPALRSSIMTVGGAEARHAAVAAKLIPTATVVPPTAAQEALATTTTTAAKATTTTTPAAQLIPVAQVPGSFGSLTAVSVAIAGQEEAWNLLGPNSYVY
jgi:hypothetical protein